jgi:hypothetical protein
MGHEKQIDELNKYLHSVMKKIHCLATEDPHTKADYELFLKMAKMLKKEQTLIRLADEVEDLCHRINDLLKADGKKPRKIIRIDTDFYLANFTSDEIKEDLKNDNKTNVVNQSVKKAIFDTNSGKRLKRRDSSFSSISSLSSFSSMSSF